MGIPRAASKGSMQDVLSYKSSKRQPRLKEAKTNSKVDSMTVSMEQGTLQCGEVFPAKLAITFGMAQCLCGVLIITFTILSMVADAAMSDVGAGLWSGTIVVVSGILGIMAGKRPRCIIYLIAFLCLGIISFAVSGLFVVLTSMGLIEDHNNPHGYYVDDEGNTIDFLGNVPLKNSAIAINAVLLIFGILSIFLALGSSVICCREACQCYSLEFESTDEIHDGMDPSLKRNRIMNWLDQIGNDLSTNFSVIKNDVKVHPLTTGVIPRLPSSTTPRLKGLKRNVSSSSSTNTVKTDLENDSNLNNPIFSHRYVIQPKMSSQTARNQSIPIPDY